MRGARLPAAHARGTTPGATMTYNFDHDAWYEREREALSIRLGSKSITQQEHDRLLEDLDRRYDEMQQSLNATVDYSSD